MKVSSDVEPEYLKRGIYQSVVYKAAITVDGEFDEIDLSKVAVDPASLHWDEAKLFWTQRFEGDDSSSEIRLERYNA